MPNQVDLNERYYVLGTVAAEHELDNRDLSSSDQHKVQQGVVYTTNDKEEAESIRRAGGFIDPKTKKWTVATSYRDTNRSEKGPIEKGN